MALAKNLEAMNAFTALPPEGKAAVIEKTHSVHSKKEMEQLVRDLGHNATMVKEEGKSPPLLYCSHVLTATYRVKHIQFS